MCSSLFMFLLFLLVLLHTLDAFINLLLLSFAKLSLSSYFLYVLHGGFTTN